MYCVLYDLMYQSPMHGVLVWKTEVGQSVSKGDLVGEIVDIEDPDMDRYPLIAQTSGK